MIRRVGSLLGAAALMLSVVLLGVGVARADVAAWASEGGYDWRYDQAVTGPATVHPPLSAGHDVEVYINDSQGHAHGSVTLLTAQYVAAWSPTETGALVEYSVPDGVTVQVTYLDYGPYDSTGGDTASSTDDFGPVDLAALIAGTDAGSGSGQAGGAAGSGSGDPSMTLTAALGDLGSPVAWGVILGYGLGVSAVVLALVWSWRVFRRVVL